MQDGVYRPGPIDNSQAKESVGVVKFDNPINEIKQMMKSAESSKILEDYFHVDFKKDAVLTKDGRVTLSTEDGVSVIVPLNRHLLSNVLK
jgi:hypothetical protein